MVISDRRPFSMPVVKHVVIPSNSANADTSGIMITRAPWPSPVNKYYVLRKIVASFTDLGASGGVLNVWDQDLSNTTPVARGSAGGPLLQVPLTPTFPQSGSLCPSMTVLDINSCPQEYFQAGIVVQPNVSGALLVSCELDVI